MPAQSPTLSPTLSAIVAGFLGSSSGMPASTLPTMSPPTSAPLVKIPPPRRAKIEISDAPNDKATSASMTVRDVGSMPSEPVRKPKYSVTPRRPRPATSNPVTAPALKARSSPPASDLVAAWATRTLARTETFMPMNPARPERIAPIAKPTAANLPSKKAVMTKITAPTMAMVIYWRLR